MLLVKLLLLLCIKAVAASTLLRPQDSNSVQKVLQRQKPSDRSSGSLLEVTADSIGVLFKTAEDVYVHTWLPVGERIFNYDAAIPRDPVMAKITTMTTSQPHLAMPESLAQVECRIFPHINETTQSPGITTRLVPQARSVTFRLEDGYIQLAARRSRFWLGGHPIDSIECR